MSATGSPPRILVVEDDASVVEAIAVMLTTNGYVVEVADNGFLGLMKQRAAPAAAAIVDVKMPEVDGIRLLEQLQEENDGALPLPVIVVTGSPEAAARCRQLIDPANVLDKPFEPSDLLARLSALLGSEGGA